ncbi:MAG: TlpA family protein disulfide reductase [Ruminococcaceae bacterium]|nr:TlpA family protein disulfide reductase [Oscillospiraceae bacterium]
MIRRKNNLIISMKALLTVILIVLMSGCSVVNKITGDETAGKPEIAESNDGKEEPSAEESSNISYKELKVGDTAPDFSAKTLKGEEFTLSDLRGRVVLINFWASWCFPCVSEMPEIQKLYDEYSRDELEIIAVNVGEKENKVEDFAKNNPDYSFNIVVDEEYLISEKYPTAGIPYTVIVSPDGVVVEIFLGSRTYEAFSSAVDKNLDI